MPAKRKVKLEDYALLKELELPIIHLKKTLDPMNEKQPLFSTEFTASGLIPLALGSDFEKEITGDVIAFFSKLDARCKKMMLTKYKELAKQITMRIVDYDVSIPGRDDNFEVIPEEIAYEDEEGNETDAEGNLI
jgi:hypothetical protein